MMQGLTANSADKEAHIDDFEILRTIGEGTFGKVKLARHILTGTQVALKVIKKRRQSFSSVQALFREVCGMKALNHPNIVKLLGAIDTEEAFILVMEYLSGGDMYHYLKIHGRMTEVEARGPFQQLLSALQHCHQRGIVHRDLKPLNLLFDSNMNIKLTDFGLSNKCDDTGQMDTICGTPPYSAPELFLGKSYSGPAVDVWSLGVVLYTMVTGCQPFGGKDFQELRKQVLQGRYHIPAYLSLEIRDLLQKMIALDPSDRGTLPDLMRHAWVNMGQKKPLQPPCEEDLKVTMVRTTGLTCDQIQDAGTGSVSSKKPKVGVSIITVRPFCCGDLSGSELEPSPSPVVSPLKSRWLSQGENVQLHEDQQAGQKTDEFLMKVWKQLHNGCLGKIHYSPLLKSQCRYKHFWIRQEGLLIRMYEPYFTECILLTSPKQRMVALRSGKAIWKSHIYEGTDNLKRGVFQSKGMPARKSWMYFTATIGGSFEKVKSNE
eukprot:bmy_12640T0